MDLAAQYWQKLAVATFAEARVVRSEPLLLEAIFTTPIGFKDEVNFRIDAAAQRIDYRSRSMLGLFDFGKNRSRMQAFTARFEPQDQRRPRWVQQPRQSSVDIILAQEFSD